MQDIKTSKEKNLDIIQEAELKIKYINSLIKRRVLDDKCAVDLDKPGSVNAGVGSIDKKPIKRLIIILKGAGCSWVLKDGGCVMCGHYVGSAKGEKVSDEKLIKQFEYAIENYYTDEYPMLCLYNGGSLLNNEEVSENVRSRIFKKISSIKSIKRVVIESRAEFVTNEILDEIETSLPNVTIEIGVGVETKNALVRNLILNKGVTDEELISLGQKFKGRRTKLLAYILVQPPFLTDRESIEDGINSIKFAKEIGASIVSLEAVSVQDQTLVSFLHKAGYYQPPWIWSLFEIVKRSYSADFEIRIGGFEFYPIPSEFTSNCQICNDDMINIIQLFNMHQNIEIIEKATCSANCRNTWKEMIQTSINIDLPTRIIQTLGSIDITEIISKMRR